MSNKAVVISASALYAVGITMLPIGWFLYRRARCFLKAAIQTHGKVIRFDQSAGCGGDGGTSYQPVFTFSDSHGVEYTVKSAWGSYPKPCKVGEFLPVFRGLLDTPGWRAHLLRCKYCVIDSGSGSSELRANVWRMKRTPA